MLPLVPLVVVSYCAVAGEPTGSVSSPSVFSLAFLASRPLNGLISALFRFSCLPQTGPGSVYSLVAQSAVVLSSMFPPLHASALSSFRTPWGKVALGRRTRAFGGVLLCLPKSVDATKAISYSLLCSASICGFVATARAGDTTCRRAARAL